MLHIIVYMFEYIYIYIYIYIYVCIHTYIYDTSAPAELGGGNPQHLANSTPYAGPSAGTEVTRLRKRPFGAFWHVLRTMFIHNNNNNPIT